MYKLYNYLRRTNFFSNLNLFSLNTIKGLILPILIPRKHILKLIYIPSRTLEPFTPEPVFVNLLRSSGIDSQSGGPVRQPYFSYRPAMLQRQLESNPRNRFLVSLNFYKYGL